MDTAGNSWQADTGYSGGNTASTSTAIQNTPNPALYQSERYGPMTYQFTVPNGFYQVHLLFAEIYWNAANKRVFNISVNGTQVEKNFDVFVAAGGEFRAVDRTYQATVTNGQLQILFSQVIENPKISAIEITPGVHVNAGGPAYMDPRGVWWAADTGYNGGKTGSTTSSISNTDSAPLYQTERWMSGTLQYTFPISNGSYAVTLKFAETYFNAVGQRVFNAAIDGQTVESNIDIFAQAPGANRALDKTYQATVTNGQLVIALSPVVQNPKISAIQVVPATTVPPPPGVSVSISPGGVSLHANQSQAFTAVVSGTTNTAVTWNINPLIGNVSSSGVYTAPPSIASTQTVQLTATSQADTTKSASTTITLTTGNVIVLTPGTDLGSAVSAQPSGTTFLLKAGVHRQQTITPKDNDVFLGETGTIINGAMLLNNFTQNGSYWVAPGPTQSEGVNGKCDSSHPMCAHSDDLFIDNQVLARASSLTGLTSGQWYFDTSAKLVYIATNPAGHTVEISVTPVAFSSSAVGVTITGLTVEKYASLAQHGAIGDYSYGTNWVVQQCEVRFNHGVGIQLGAGAQILNNFVHNNGQKGLGISANFGPGGLVSGNEISYSNYAGFDAGWEAGGTKFWQTTNLVVSNNNVHDNTGPGLWTDTDNTGTLYDGNTVTNNRDAGIQHEVSQAAIIRNNICKGNGQNPGWLWQSQIMIQNSQNVEAYNNTVTTTATNGNGIGIVNQNRGSGHYGEWTAINNYVHDNDITYESGSNANSGVVADYNASVTMNPSSNRFDSNHYHLSNTSASVWQWNAGKSWASFQAVPQEAHGTVDTKIVN